MVGTAAVVGSAWVATRSPPPPVSTRNLPLPHTTHTRAATTTLRGNNNNNRAASPLPSLIPSPPHTPRFFSPQPEHPPPLPGELDMEELDMWCEDV